MRLTGESFSPEADVEQLVTRELASWVSPTAMVHEESEVLATVRRIIALVRHHEPRGPGAR